MLNIVFYEPRIPGNTGAAIRLAACTSASLHLIEPLGFDFSDAHLKRAGLDYHDIASLIIHNNYDDFLATTNGARIFAFTGHTANNYADVRYQPGDYLLFGPEPTGLPARIVQDSSITQAVRIPMMPHLRSLNLANAASIAVYEAWRQLGFNGSAPFS
ncbi:tRNA (cytidine(34)-2'-O)-methyltransferase [Actinotignum urinale]|uniref:tRNA (cytidine(34)-2'-O)-methyltransferase n=1 Tax=Actinotignum urinale TaxID=190146 RepID=UPI00041305C5|nr:tRNA (cytidine(34)-2'-O)-methyltransferase [Actinotignum urinale]MDY5160325.1 tRNA (cytidine(34)-2'-O)-methyltransferase [Actinotignum urinale]WIK59027.1 tRNA (cytidine(34)-2'-O)-methyltransferase [Actinotignum urinale]